jgi:hypothetical protein
MRMAQKLKLAVALAGSASLGAAQQAQVCSLASNDTLASCKTYFDKGSAGVMDQYLTTSGLFTIQLCTNMQGAWLETVGSDASGATWVSTIDPGGKKTGNLTSQTLQTISVSFPSTILPLVQVYPQSEMPVCAQVPHTSAPTTAPTLEPTKSPTTTAPTAAPTLEPTKSPTATAPHTSARPTRAPTTATPTTKSPTPTAPHSTATPTLAPTKSPTATAPHTSARPTRAPTTATPTTKSPTPTAPHSTATPTLAPTKSPTQTTPALTPAPTPATSQAMSVGLIAGLSAAGGMIIVIVLLVVLLCRHRKAKRADGLDQQVPPFAFPPLAEKREELYAEELPQQTERASSRQLPRPPTPGAAGLPPRESPPAELELLDDSPVEIQIPPAADSPTVRRIRDAFMIGGPVAGWTEYVDRETGDGFWVSDDGKMRNERPSL